MIVLSGANWGAEAGPITQLLYRSRSLIGRGSMLQMSGILAEARPANARDDITGVLTCVSGRFVQVVEGRASAIDDLMRRLARDDRHTDLDVLERRTVGERAFGDWDMVSPRLAVEEVEALGAMIARPTVGLDAVIPVLLAAVETQGEVLEGRSTTVQALARRAFRQAAAG